MVPDYNSITTTVCHNIAKDLSTVISDPTREIELICIDDILMKSLAELSSPNGLETCFALDTWRIVEQ